ncbi:hypothetical protein MSNKSG1_10408 [Marinobacter santoriniensis NKSG1]|uniref:Uncharacterized protein n=1 Tax=Marinobacter santoriniensis NKSG1 TaxID=1288826 RepID=M7CT06_9GAMM|nr:hypothetical protein [Marinobacter santoriniensis]EMP56279.1 hypothetical protein MSNKSG1_10408 [Marinobacter santoriniensis NKSG1]
MTNDTVQISAAFVGAGAIGLGLLSLIAMITFGFSRVALIEKKISRPDSTALQHSKFWGDDPLGRLMRSSYVFTFLVLRSVPSNRLKRSAAQIGDTSARLPVTLTLWAILPPLMMYGCFAVLLIVSLFL